MAKASRVSDWFTSFTEAVDAAGVIDAVDAVDMVDSPDRAGTARRNNSAIPPVSVGTQKAAVR
jgi:hypothetical protein